MYTFDSRVRYSEVGEDARITVNAIIDYMQDCTNFQSEDLGVGLEYHKKKQLMWVLNSWQIVIEKYPAMGEEITVGTQAYGFEKMFGYRNFLIIGQFGRMRCESKFHLGFDGFKKEPSDDRNTGDRRCLWRA